MPRRKKVDIELDGLPKLFGAEVYQESSWFVCVLPDDVRKSVVGRGDSVAEAINAWDVNLKGHLRNGAEDDPIVMKAKSLIGSVPKDDEVPSVITEKIKSHVTEFTQEAFEAQFYTSKKYK